MDRVRLDAGKLRFEPCIPAEWPSFKVHYRHRGTLFHITVLQFLDGNGETSIALDGVEQPDRALPLVDDKGEHSVEVRIHRTPV